MDTELTKEWAESFTLEEGLMDCSAGILSLSDLIHFAEPDPSDETPVPDKKAVLRLRKRTTRQSTSAAPAKGR